MIFCCLLCYVHEIFCTFNPVKGDSVALSGEGE